MRALPYLPRMILGDIADGVLRRIETMGDAVTGVFEPTLRLGVTGLARSGKTVFITSLVANLLDRGRMPQLARAADGSIKSAWLQPQPDDTVPRFDFEGSLAALTGPEPHWPEPTASVSELRLSLKVQPSGLLGAARGLRTVHLDIVDYPGEWLLDLTLLDRSFEDWSADVLAKLRRRPEAEAFLARLDALAPEGPYEEPDAKALAESYTEALREMRRAGLSDITPGRFLMPGEMKGSPALTFAPLPPGDAPRRSLRREMRRRYDAYVAKVAKPFFRDHFARIDRQVVLVDVLGAIHAGPAAVEDLRSTLEGLLRAFRPGATAFLTRLLGTRRVERILFAATKADHLHHSQHARLTALMQALVNDAKRRADFAGARTSAMSIASVRATTEATVEHAGTPLDVVRGRLLDTGREAALHPGELPEDPSWLLDPAREGKAWVQDYSVMRFAPAPMTLRPGEGPPHIRLDRAAEFLIGDAL